MSGMLSLSTGVWLGMITCSWTPHSTSAGMLVEGSLLGTASRIAWIAYTERKSAGGAASAVLYGCDGGSPVDLAQEKLAIRLSWYCLSFTGSTGSSVLLYRSYGLNVCTASSAL